MSHLEDGAPPKEKNKQKTPVARADHPSPFEVASRERTGGTVAPDTHRIFFFFKVGIPF